MPEPADVNLDELKRRARRRLVGAVVLALAAAVFVPMLLESDPRPLGDDVAVKIPPVDDGKFVNRLNEPKSKGAPPKLESPKSEPSKSETPKSAPPPTEPSKSAGPQADAPKSPAKDSTSEATKDAGKDAAPASTAAPSQNKTLAEAEQRVLSPSPKGAPKPPPPDVKVPPIDAPKTAPPPAPAPAPAAKAEPPPANGAFVVQLAAFIDDKGANALAGKLKKSGYEAYTEPLTTSRGTLWRVRVGPFPTREAAVAVRDKLKNEGQNGIVAAK